MRTLHVDDATYAEWEQRAKARGLSVEAWLKTSTNGGEAAGEDFDAEQQRERLRRFEATLESYGGRPEFNRHDLYD